MLIKTIVLLQVFVCNLAFEVEDLPPEWHAWKATHGKLYGDKHEELTKHIVWRSNKEYIDEHNKHEDVFGYTLEMNKYGDMTNAEFVKEMMCVREHEYGGNITDSLIKSNPEFKGKVSEYKMPESLVLPETVDWRTGGAVTKVKDQLRCGCSYAFAAVGALEGATALAKGQTDPLSAQNIVDCSIPYGNHGCSCGDVMKSFMYVIDNGLDTEESYRYIARQYYCRYKASGVGATATGFVTIQSGDENALASALATAGPIAVYIDASSNSFQFYKSGVLNVPNCSRSMSTHAMVLIGLGSDGGNKYWLLKNSWGPNWGISGYIKMSRGKSNQCGIATNAIFPTL